MRRILWIFLLFGSVGLGCGSDHTVAGLDGALGFIPSDSVSSLRIFRVESYVFTSCQQP
jgi:hypothetical protein